MIRILRQVPIISISAIETCDLFIHINEFNMTGGYRMVSPETQEFYDIQDQIVAKQAQVNGATGAAKLTFIAQLDALRALAESMLVRDEGECIAKLRYSAVNSQGVEIPFQVNGLQNNFVFYVSDMADIVVDPQENEYQLLREKAKRYVLQKLKDMSFLGLLDSEYEIA